MWCQGQGRRSTEFFDHKRSHFFYNLLVGTGATLVVTQVVAPNVLSGTFQLSYVGKTLGPIAVDAVANTLDSGNDGTSLQEILQAVSTLEALDVSRSMTPDDEGGHVWDVTFRDEGMNPGRLSLLGTELSGLRGAGATVHVGRVTAGSVASGSAAAVSFHPPMTDAGTDVLKYQVVWDTASNFLANPALLGNTQRVMVTAPSLTWSALQQSGTVPPHVRQVQTVVSTTTSFTLTFRGATTDNFDDRISFD